jgi:hypothetical protein
MTIPWVIGQLFQAVGPQAVPLVVSFAILASIVVLLVLSAEGRRTAALGEGHEASPAT